MNHDSADIQPAAQSLHQLQYPRSKDLWAWQYPGAYASTRTLTHTHTQTEHTCTKEAFVNNEKHSNDNYCYDQLVGCFIFLFIINTATINDRVKSVQQIYEIKSIQVDHGITSEGWWGNANAMIYIISKKYMFLVFNKK